MTTARHDGLRFLSAFFVAALALTGAPVGFGAIIYVDAGAPVGTNDGETWATAFRDLQQALSAAGAGDQIWVAEGTYRPTQRTIPTDERSVTFQLISGVGLYGGFPPGGGAWDHRDPGVYETILSGELGNPGYEYDNARHVVTAAGADSTAVLDGFTVRDGNSVFDPELCDCNVPDHTGAGILNASGHPTISRCHFINNLACCGGAMANRDNGVGERPRVTDCTFTGNAVFLTGGAVHNFNSGADFISCDFRQNWADDEAGAVMTFLSGDPLFIGCSFYGNHCEASGGAVENFYPNAVSTFVNSTFVGNTCVLSGAAVRNRSGGLCNLTNCTLTANIAEHRAGGVYNSSGSESFATITNCVLWANVGMTDATSEVDETDQILDAGTRVSDVRFTCIQDADADDATIPYGGAANGNLDDDPHFERMPDPGPDLAWGTSDDDYGDLRIGHTNASPCVDAGDNTAVPADALDLDGDANTTEPLPFDLLIVPGRTRFYDDPQTPDTGNCGTPCERPIVDMGAFEFQILANAIYVDAATCGDPIADGSPAHPFCTIQAGIDAASDGDEVIVLPGVYTGDGNRDLDFSHGLPSGQTRAITVRSDDPTSGAVVAATVVDCQGSVAEPHRAFAFRSGEGSKSIVDGLTLTGGFAPADSLAQGGIAGGGAVYCHSASPVIRRCAVRNSMATVGGAILCEDSGAQIVTCTVEDNHATTGGGIAAYASPIRVTDSTIQHNAADLGAGILCDAGSDGWITNCTIRENPGAGKPVGYGGGGITCRDGSDASIQACVIRLNEVTAEGGGILCLSSAPSVSHACQVNLNRSQSGGGLYADNTSRPTLLDSVFDANAGTEAIYASGDLGITIEACTIRNTAPNTGCTVDDCATGVRLEFSGNVALRDCDITGNAGDGIDLLWSYGTVVERCAIVSNGWRGLSDWFGVAAVYDCTLAGNLGDFGLAKTYGLLGPVSGLQIDSDTAGLTQVTVLLDAPQPDAPAIDVPEGIFECRSDSFIGDGSIGLGADSYFVVASGPDGNGIFPSGPTVVATDVLGDGSIWIQTGEQLVVGGSAVVDVGTITVDGSLVVQDRAVIQNTQIDVRIAQLDDQVSVHNNDIALLESSFGYGGEFYVDGRATVTSNVITSAGDRYLDLDPDPSAVNHPTIAGNQFTVIINQGALSSYGELLELRATDHDNTIGGGQSGAYELAQSPGYGDTWALEELRVLGSAAGGAKVNLTNRNGFEYQPLGSTTPEALYVKKLVLHPNAVLNTGHQRLYYQQLLDESGTPLVRDPQAPSAPMANGSRIIDIPLLGFSLKRIDMDDDAEFAVRVRSPQKQSSLPNHGAVQRLADARGPNDGVMELRTETASSVAAKGAFARAGDERITIYFSYRFLNAGTDGDAELGVFLSDNMNVGESNVQVATIRPPAAGRAETVPLIAA